MKTSFDRKKRHFKESTPAEKDKEVSHNIEKATGIRIVFDSLANLLREAIMADTCITMICSYLSKEDMEEHGAEIRECILGTMIAEGAI